MQGSGAPCRDVGRHAGMWGAMQSLVCIVLSPISSLFWMIMFESAKDAHTCERHVILAMRTPVQMAAIRAGEHGESRGVRE